MMYESEGFIGDQVEHAFFLWCQGFTIAPIAQTIKVPEHIIANNIEGIKRYAPTSQEDAA